MSEEADHRVRLTMAVMDAITKTHGGAKSDDVSQALLAVLGMLFARETAGADASIVEDMCEAFGADLFKMTRTYIVLFEQENEHAWDMAMAHGLH